ncbi:MAG: hypothetical protein JXB10_09040 [Pirellulales bacterium]|nr:hypothetical protein [Pirellulales bacterium]
MDTFLSLSPYIAVFAVTLAVILLILLLWRRREQRRMEALEIANEIHGWGLEQTSRLLTAYAIGNYFGQDSVTRVVREIVAEIRSGGLPAMLRKVGWKVVKNVFLETPDDLARLKELIAQVETKSFNSPQSTSA